MNILLVGDVHADWESFIFYLKYMEKNNPIDCVIQVGDFGVFPGYLKRLQQSLFKHKINIPIYFIDGNHEDHDYIRNLSKKSNDNFDLHYVQRGTILEFDNRKIGFIGGAYHVDRPQEKFVSKYDSSNTYTNYIEEEEIYNFLNIINENKLDMMITHTCPGGIGVGIMGSTMFSKSIKMYIENKGFTSYGIYDSGDYPLTLLWKNLKNKPSNWVFGHYHKYHYSKVEKTQFHCIGCAHIEQQFNRYFIYDTELNEVKNWRFNI